MNSLILPERDFKHLPELSRLFASASRLLETATANEFVWVASDKGYEVDLFPLAEHCVHYMSEMSPRERVDFLGAVDSLLWYRAARSNGIGSPNERLAQFENFVEYMMDDLEDHIVNRSIELNDADLNGSPALAHRLFIDGCLPSNAHSNSKRHA